MKKIKLFSSAALIALTFASCGDQSSNSNDVNNVTNENDSDTYSRDQQKSGDVNNVDRPAIDTAGNENSPAGGSQ